MRMLLARLSALPIEVATVVRPPATAVQVGGMSVSLREGSQIQQCALLFPIEQANYRMTLEREATLWGCPTELFRSACHETGSGRRLHQHAPSHGLGGGAGLDGHHVVDRLAGKGVVVRVRAEHARRLVLVEFTEKSKQHRRLLFRERVALIAQIFEPLGNGASEQVVRVSGRIAAQVAAHKAALLVPSEAGATDPSQVGIRS